jgi:hypothetical protein
MACRPGQKVARAANARGCTYGRLQGAGDGDQLMEGKEELWGPGERGAHISDRCKYLTYILCR